jgi:uncharacterized SAM-binding protein YcdF (DUF218 family)
MNSLYFKYIIGHFLQPFSLLIFIIFCCYLLILLNKKLKLAKTIMALAIGTLYVLSTPYGANQLLAPLEFKYEKFKQPTTPLNFIVVLGCAHNNGGYLPQSSKLAACSQVRAHEAFLLYQANPGARIVFTGGGSANTVTLSEHMASFADLMGIDKSNIIIETRPLNTEQEVAFVSSLLVDAQTALVTSAAHMPRAMYLFKQQGLELIAAPTDYLIRYELKEPHLRFFIPEVDNLEKVNSAAHEYYGLWWIYLNEWFDD